MPETTLRSLAKAYAKKTIEQAAYREARAKFINGVLSGEIKLSVNEYPPLIRPKPDAATEPTLRRFNEKKKPDLPKPEEQPARPVINPKLAAGGAIATLLALLIIGVFMFSGDDEPSPAEPVAAAAPNMAQQLLSEFLAQRNWAASGNLDAFIRNWQNLPAETRAAAAGTLELNQLTNAIYKQLLEERALSGIGDAEAALNRQKKLIEFAAQVGINDPRIAMPESN
jgi:hypothetical protein